MKWPIASAQSEDAFDSLRRIDEVVKAERKPKDPTLRHPSNVVKPSPIFQNIIKARN